MNLEVKVIALILVATFYCSNAVGLQQKKQALDSTARELIKILKESGTEKSDSLTIHFQGKIKSPDQLVRIYFEVGNSFYSEKNYPKSIYYFLESLEFTKRDEGDVDLSMQILLKLGNASLLTWQNQEALEFYYALEELAIKEKSLHFQVIAKSNIAIVLRRMNQLDKALTNCHELLSIIDKTSFKNAKNHVNILTIISEVHLDRQELEEVLQYAEEGIKISLAIDYKYGLLDLYIKKAIVFHQREQFDRSFDLLKKAETIIQEEGIKSSSSQVINVNYFLASHYYRLKSHERAINYLKNTIQAVDSTDFRKNRVIETYFLLSKIYYDMDKVTESVASFAKYDEIRKLYNRDKEQTVNKIHQKGTQSLKDQIEELQRQQRLADRNKDLILVGLVLILLLLLVISTLYFQKQKANKFKFEELIKQIALLESQEEKKDVAKEIVINDHKIQAVIQGLKKLEDQHYYLSKDCNLREMAKKVKTNATYLSQIFNNHIGKSYNDYIRDLRIEYAMKRLKNDKKFRSFSIKFIALEVGYKSDNSFTKHFKARTGLYPSFYIKNIEKFQHQNVEV